MSVTISGSGQIVKQIQSYTLTSTVATTATTPVDSGLQISITPTNAANKILICATINMSHDQLGVKRTYFNFSGGNSSSYIGGAGSSGHQSSFAVCPRAGDSYGMVTASGMYLDSPATTSAITYKLQWCVETGTGYLNRPASEDANGARTASTITVMEIAYA